jgi:hypothetical protein
MVHSQRRLISDKGKALSTVIDERKRLMWEEVLVLENVSQKYAVLITDMTSAPRSNGLLPPDVWPRHCDEISVCLWLVASV